METKYKNVGGGGVCEKNKMLGGVWQIKCMGGLSAKKIKCVGGVRDFFQSVRPEDFKWNSPYFTVS